MTLQEILEAIEELQPDDLEVVQARLDMLIKRQIGSKQLAFREFIKKFQEGLTEEQFEQMDWAIKAKYIKPFDQSEWHE